MLQIAGYFFSYSSDTWKNSRKDRAIFYSQIYRLIYRSNANKNKIREDLVSCFETINFLKTRVKHALLYNTRKPLIREIYTTLQNVHKLLLYITKRKNNKFFICKPKMEWSPFFCILQMSDFKPDKVITYYYTPLTIKHNLFVVC
jgi:hypothetical protein